jgi:DNA-binding SARP family transcriptional activator/predicted ATPase
MAPTLRLHLFGDFSLVYGEEQVTSVNTPRLHSLLAYLALHHDAPQLRQRLAFLFWPDTGEAQARTNLRQLLHQLRHALPDADAFLYADASAVYWRSDAPFQLDVVEFEHALALADAAARADDQRAALEQATTLYRAHLLPNCYDDWIVPERERLHLRHQQALQRLIQLLEARRDYSAAIHHTQRLLRDDPINEAAYRDLMRLLMLNNDRAGALRVYQTCVTALRRELGVEPSQQTREAYERLLRLKPPGTPAPQRHARREAGLPLIGRQCEWEQLRIAWRQASAGEPGVALIMGEAGIGKSRLAEELLAWANQQGVGMAKTRCYAAEGQLSLAPATDWLRSDTLRPYLTQLDTVWRVEVSRILPELLATQSELPPYEPMTELGQRQRFFEALARAVLASAQPLLLLIDDLQWCDQETIEWLHFLLRFDPQARLLVVGTIRADEAPPQHPLRALLLALRSTVDVTELTLQPLDAAETAKLAAHVTGRELDVESTMWLYRETEGNPLFVVETMRAGFERSASSVQGATFESDPSAETKAQGLAPDRGEESKLPARVQAVIAGRLARLSASARELAELAATIGRSFTLDLLLEAGDGDEDHVAHALDELWQKRIVREQGANSYDFTHDKLREIAYVEISTPQRRRLHRRIAQALERTSAETPAATSGQIASHYERAGMTEQAIPHYQRAAVVAQRLYANEDAINLLSCGLALLEQAPAGAKRDTQELNIQLALAPLYRMTKGWTSPEVERVLARAQALCDIVGDDTQRAQVWYGLQSLYAVQAKLEKVQLVSDDLHHIYQRAHGASPPLVADMMLTGSRLHLGRLADANAEFAQMIATHDPTHLQRIVEEQGWNYAVQARAWHAHALWLLGYPQAALQRGLDAMRLARDLAQPFNQAIATAYLALLQQFCADEATARAHAEQALALTTEYKAPYYRTWSAILVSYALACEQPAAPAIAGLREAIEEFKASGARLRLPYYLGLLACAYGRAGQAEEGLAAIDEGMAAARMHNERWWDAELQRLRGELLFAGSADARAAEAAYLRAIAIARAQQARALELRAATSLARLWRTQRRAADARLLLGEIYTWFTEGLETPDLQAAQSLLAQL